MRGLETRLVIARLSRLRVLAGGLALALAFVLVGPAGLGSAVAAAPGITSVAPTGGTTAGGGTITITGLGFGTAAPAVTIGGTAATNVVLVSDTTVTATIPAGTAGLADVVVTPVGGQPLTLTSGYEYAAPAQAPLFDTIAPASGPITGGDPVTISGSYLDRVTEIQFGATRITHEYFVNRGANGSSITVNAPASSLGTVDITLTASNATSVTKYAAYTYVPPTVTAITPTSGPSTGGTAVTITGTGFGTGGGISVTIGGVAATNVVRLDSTRVTATTGAGTVGVANVVVTPSGSGAITGTGLFTYAPSVSTPSITAITPNSGPIAGGQVVTVTGANFRASDSSLATITFGGTAGTVQSVATNGKSMTVVVPAHAVGAVDVVVSTRDGRATMRNGFTYSASPTITSLSPASGITAGGTFVTLTGTGFGATGVPTVTVGGRAALCVARASDTIITFVAPAGVSAGAKDVEVTPATRGGSVISTGAFTYVAATTFPTITAVSPANGLTAGGTAITITGTGFTSATTPSVLIGGACATGVTVVNATTITATTPTGVAGTRDVVVTTATGTVTASAAFSYADAPAILSLNPTSGSTTGGYLVTINGRGFGNSGTPVVTIGGTAATSVQRLSDTQLRVTVPAGPLGAQTVQVTPAGGSLISKPNAFTYVSPSITSLSPFAGTTRGGTPVTITGSGFGESGTPTVTFGGVAATSVVRVSSTQVTAVTPAGAAGAVTVVVTPATGPAVGTKGAAYSYVTDVVTPVILSSLPSRGPTEGGITVYLTGSHFFGSNSVAATVKVGTVSATNVVVATGGTSLTFRAPALAPGSYDVTVTTSDGSTTQRWAYTVAGPPVVDSCSAVSPRVTSPDAGTSVTVTGVGFGTSGTPGVTVGGVPATVTASSDTSVTFVVPAGPLGYPQIVVRPTTGGTALTLSGCLFRTSDLRITAANRSINFGDPSPTFSATAAGLLGSDALSSVTYTFSGNGYGPSTVIPTNAGSYTVTPSNAVLSPGDISYYSVQYVPGTFTIHGLEATLTAAPASKVYGDADPVFTSTITGLKSGHTLTGVGYSFVGIHSTSYGPSTTPPTNAGTYRVTPTAAQVGGAESNYSFTYNGADYTITQRPITIGATPLFKVYGNADPALVWSVRSGSLAYDDALYGSLTRQPGENVGQYDILRGTVDDPNYSITYESDVLDITPRPIAVVARDASKVYGEADPELIADSDGLIDGDSLDGYLAREAGENVGTYEITRGTLTAGPNYEITSFTGGEFTITPRPIELTLSDASKIYGANDPALLVELTGGSLIGSDQISGAASRESGENVGTYAIGGGSLTAGSNYEITFVDGTLTIDPRPIEITAVTQSKAYGDADPSPLDYTITKGSLVGDDKLAGILTREAGEAVGAYPILAGTLSAGPNYSVTVVDGELTITPRPITVTADDATQVYGDADAPLTWQVTTGSLVGGDSLAGSLEREPGTDVGSYAITRGSLDNESYTITFVAGSLEVTPRPITVRADATSKEFGESDPTLTASADGLVEGDSLFGALTRESGENVGDYAITAGTISAGDNYSVTFQPGTFQITPRSLELTADDTTAVYGDALPAGTVSITSGALVSGDALSGATFGYDVTEPKYAGTYVSTPSAATFSAGSASNYSITYRPGTLTITPLSITVTPDPQTKVYGFDDPAFTYSVAPALIGSDTLFGALSRDGGEDVGAYAITQGSLVAGPNYALSIESATLEIDPRPLSIVANGATKIYGDGDPELTWSILGGSLRDGDQLFGALTREPGEDAGTYAITQGDLGNANYEIDFAAGNLTISPRDISIVIDNNGKEYGDTDPELSVNVDGLVFDDELSGSPVRDDGENVGAYNIRLGSITAGDNYTIRSVTEGTFTISTRALVLAVDNASITYGDAIPDFTYTVLGGSLLDGDTIESVDFQVDGDGMNVGDYEVTLSNAVIDGGASNYDIHYQSGLLSVAPLAITVTADDVDKQYGDLDPEFTWTSSPALLGGDTLAGTLSREAGESVGTYAITQGTLSAGPNYSLEVVGGELEITVRTLEITAGAASKVYGDADPLLTWSITEGSLLGDDQLTGSLTREEGEDVGTYAITRGDLDNPNYVIEFVPSMLSIGQRDLTIVIDSFSKQYGDEDPTLTAHADALAFDDQLTGTPTREVGESRGAYAITQGTVTASNNYSIVAVVPGTLEITQQAITVRADDITLTYGDPIPTTGTASVVEGSLAFIDALGSATLTTDSSGDVGRYEIAPSDVAFTKGQSANYDITYVPGTLTIQPLAIEVVPNAASKSYGDLDPALTYSVSPDLVGDDTIDGALAREAGENVGDHPFTLGTLSAGSNYELSIADAQFEIVARAISVTADAASRVYGDDDPALTWTVTEGSLVDGDSLGGSLERESGSSVGEYDITQGSLGNANYDITFTGSTFTITKRPLVVTLGSGSKTYGDDDSAFEVIGAEGLVLGDGVPGTAAREPGEDVGTYAVTAGTLSASDNYDLTVVPGSFEIVPRTLTVRADDASSTYGDLLPVPTATADGLVGDDELASATLAFDPSSPVGVGSYPIIVSDAVIGEGSVDNYDIEYVPGTLTIDPLEITVSADAASKTYGDADPALTFTTAPNLLGGDELAGSLSREPGEGVGEYATTLGTLSAGDNYSLSFEPSTFEISAREITVTASAASKVYGDADPAWEWTVTTGTVIEGDEFTGTFGRASGEDVGAYALLLGSFGNANYDVSFVTANLSITPRPITVRAVDGSRQYGATELELSAVSDDLLNGDVLTGAPTRAPGDDVGEYVISRGTIEAGMNYSITSFETGTYTIEPREIEVTAGDKSITYGDADPELTYDVTTGSIVSDDAFSGSLTRAAGDDAGQYAITAGSLTLGTNYELTVVPGTLTIQPRVIGITADDASRGYGEADPAELPYTVTSGTLAEGDVPAGALQREPGEAVGEYAILPGTLDAGPNYRFTVEGGTFTITQRPITVTADATTAVFGDADPALTWAITSGSLVSGDSLTGSLEREAGVDVGEYDIALGSLGNANYDIEFVPAVHTITPRPLTVVGDDIDIDFGDSEPTLTATVSGLVGDDELSGEPTRVSGTDAGTYDILRGTLAASENYEIVTYTPGTLTIHARPIGITLDDASRAYGDPDPEFTFSVTSGELIGDDSISGTPSREAGEDVGEYEIAAGGLTAGTNYALEVTPATLTITPREAMVIVSDAYTAFGDPTPTFTLTPDGLVTGDSITSSEPTFDGDLTVPTLPGTYAVGAIITGVESGLASNYDFSVVPGSWYIESSYAVLIDPNVGLTLGGLPFEIRGSGFGFDTPAVYFDGLAATDVTLIDSSHIIGLTPEHAVGTVTVTVETAGGLTDLVDAYTYVEPVPGPMIYSISPARGPVDGGTSFDITGEHLVGTDGEPAVVLVDGAPASGVTVSEDGLSLVAVSPPGVVGPRDVDVLTVDGGVTYLNGFEYYDGPAGTVSGDLWLDLDADGTWDDSEAPLAGILLDLVPQSDSSFAPAAALTATATTDAHGHYVFENIPYGEWALQFTGPGGLTRTGTGPAELVTIDVTVDSPELELDVPLVGHSGFDGAVVTYSDGSIAAGVTVTIRWAGPDGVLGTPDDVVITTVTDDDGHFSVPNLPGGSYEVSGRDEAGNTFGPVAVTLAGDGESTGAEFEIAMDSEPGPGTEVTPQGLAATGVDAGSLALTAFALLLVGVLFARRRRSSER